jgi:hypothetical protein
MDTPVNAFEPRQTTAKKSFRLREVLWWTALLCSLVALLGLLFSTQFDLW